MFLERGANLESRAAHTHPKNTQVPPREGTMINWSTLMKKFMQTRCKRSIVIVCGSILNVSTVYLNGIWHLICRYLLKPVLGGHPLLCPGGGGCVLPYITYTGMCRPTGSWFRTGYPFQWRFLERGIVNRTHESSSFVSSHLKLLKDRLLLKRRF